MNSSWHELIGWVVDHRRDVGFTARGKLVPPGIVTQKLENARYEPRRRFRRAILPIGDGPRVGADLLGYFSLQETEIETSPLYVFSQ